MWEFMVFFFEIDGVINFFFLILFRFVFFCKYNFFCFFGLVKLVMIKEDEIDRKFRFYNYKKLCVFVRKGVYFLDDNLFVVMFEVVFL